MADSHTGRLCAEIVHSHFGPLTAKVASVILRRGRLSFPQIVHHTSIKPRTVRACILVLVQHNVLWHTQSSEEGEMFDFNVDECLLRLRFGKFVWLAEKLIGKAASEIVQLILDNGKLRMPDILAHLTVSDSKSIAMYTQAMHKLVSAHYLKPSTILSHISPRDKRIKYEAEEKSKIKGFPTAKELREAKEVAMSRLKREEEEAEKVSLKRKAKDQPGSKSNKRKTATEEDVVDDTVFFKVNSEKFSVHIRNEFLIKAVRERYNEGAAVVLRAILKSTEGAQVNVKESRTDPLSVASIIMQLSDEDDAVKSGLIHSSKKASTSTNVKEYLGLLSAADNPTSAGKAGSFISYSSSKVQVEFEIIGRRLRRRVLETVTREKHGVEGLRILRLLHEMGKLDEKQISKIVMMAPKDVRPLLSAMAVDSLISMQEVPKTADRNPTRTFYLWYVDLHKAYSTMVGDICKTLYNISTRRRAEEEVSEVRMVLEKRERSDVSQDESLLSRLERDILVEWEKKQLKMFVLEQRMEETLFVMRDLAVLGIGDD